MLFSRSSKNKLNLIIDIGSGSVGAGLVLESANRPRVLFQTRSNIDLSSNLNFNSFLSEMTKSLRQVIEKVSKSRKGMPTKIRVFLSSPWAVSQTRVIKLRKNAEFTFTKKIADEYVGKEICNFEKSSLNVYKNENQNMRLIEKELFQIKLNGYKTNNPFGKKTMSFEMFLFLTASPEKVIDFVAYEIKKFFNLPVKFSSFVLPSFVTIRDIFPDDRNFIMIDVAGEITDVSLIKDDILLETSSFPLGRNSLIYNIAKLTGHNKTLAETFLDLYVDDKIQDKYKEKIRNILLDYKKEWMKCLSKIFAIISKKIFLPSKIYLTADEDVEKLFKKYIEEEEWGQYFVTESKFNVIILNNLILHRFCKVESSQGGFTGWNYINDPFIAIESIFISNKPMNE